MELLRQLEERPKEQFVRGYIAALIYVGLGDKAKAIDCLEREYLNHDNIDTSWIRTDQILDPLRGDPRFEALAEKMCRPASSARRRNESDVGHSRWSLRSRQKNRLERVALS